MSQVDEQLGGATDSLRNRALLLYQAVIIVEIDQQAELIRAGANVSTRWGKILHLCRRHPLGAVGTVIVFVMAAVFADVVSPHDPLQTSAPPSLLAPNAEHLMGADMMGDATRDILDPRQRQQTFVLG